VLTTRHAPLERSGKITIRPYELSHFKRLVVRPHEENIKRVVKLSDTEWAKAIGKEAVAAYTGYVNGEIFAIGGLNILWEGVGEVWVIGSPTIPTYRFSYVKAVKFYLNYFRKEYKLKRVQAQIVSDYDMLRRFVEKMGFTYEGTLHNYCGGDLDNCMYAIWE
jgi:hypothetical protein